MAILSLLERAPSDGCAISRQIEEPSDGMLKFALAALYPRLYRMEKRGKLHGAWETSASRRRRHCYRLDPRGRKMRESLRAEWDELHRAMRRLAKVSHA